MKFLSIAALIFVTIIAINVVASEHDAVLLRTAAEYERCVQQKYGMTPLRWYAEHHKYPLCDK